MQTWPLGHAVPQVPQCAGSLFVSTQIEPHCTVPTPQLREHVPFEQIRPAPHAFPHAPQLAVSLEKSTQPPSQADPPPVQLSAAASAPVSGTPVSTEDTEESISVASAIVASTTPVSREDGPSDVTAPSDG